MKILPKQLQTEIIRSNCSSSLTCKGILCEYLMDEENYLRIKDKITIIKAEKDIMQIN